MKTEYEKKVKILAASLLQIAGEQFSNHGCNDMPDGSFDGWSEDEKKEFLKDVDKWNKGSLDLDDPEQLGDDTAMRVCGYILLKSTK